MTTAQNIHDRIGRIEDKLDDDHEAGRITDKQHFNGMLSINTVRYREFMLLDQSVLGDTREALIASSVGNYLDCAPNESYSTEALVSDLPNELMMKKEPKATEDEVKAALRYLYKAERIRAWIRPDGSREATTWLSTNTPDGWTMRVSGQSLKIPTTGLDHAADPWVSWGDVILIDCETFSRDGVDLTDKKVSLNRYAAQAHPVLITYAEGLDGEVKVWEWKDFDNPPNPDDIPAELREWDGYFMAHNARFDRKMLDPLIGTIGDRWLDSMVICQYNALPGGLGAACTEVGVQGKVGEGKDLIKLFSGVRGSTGTRPFDSPDEAPDEWARYKKYAVEDVRAMQRLLRVVPNVPITVWEEYHASEEVNDLGIPLDLDLIKAAIPLGEASVAHSAARLTEITGGEIKSPRARSLSLWIWQRASPAIRDMMVEADRPAKVVVGAGDGADMFAGGDAVQTGPSIIEQGGTEYKIHLNRELVIEPMIAALEASGEDDTLLEALRVRQYAVSNPAAKMEAADALRTFGRLCDNFRYTGTTPGRFKSYGAQIHNLSRGVVGNTETEEKVIAFLRSGPSVEDFEAEVGMPVGQALPRLARPMIRAMKGHTLIWADYGQIEARIQCWIAGDNPQALAKVQAFREIDADPKNNPDMYIRAAAGMFGQDAHDLMRRRADGDKVAEGFRQKGKIAELALGYAGGPGAIQSMSKRGFTDEEAGDIVGKWRDANQWIVRLWDDCMTAFKSSLSKPGEIFTAGRLRFQCIVVGGKPWVQVILPCGRRISFRDPRMTKRPVKDPFDSKRIISWESDFTASMGDKFRTRIYSGSIFQNSVQACAASLLREAITTLDHGGYGACAHCHDEVMVECKESDAEETAKIVTDTMLNAGAEWVDGLPLTASCDINHRYSKTLG